MIGTNDLMLSLDPVLGQLRWTFPRLQTIWAGVLFLPPPSPLLPPAGSDFTPSHVKSALCLWRSHTRDSSSVGHCGVSRILSSFFFFFLQGTCLLDPYHKIIRKVCEIKTFYQISFSLDLPKEKPCAAVESLQGERVSLPIAGTGVCLDRNS